jgi:hypothetical protein
VRAPEVPRPALEAQARAAAEGGPPLLLTGPPGAGKTTLLLALARDLERSGWSPIYLDLMGAASSPDRFVRAALDALTADRFGGLLREATDIRRLVDAGRPQHAQAVRAVFALWASLHTAAGRPVALLLDEATEARSLAYFPGLREVDRLLGAALAARKRATVLATSFPTLARRSFDFPELRARPLSAAEIAAALPAASAPQADAVVRASFGWPRYAAVFIEGVLGGRPPAATWRDEMARGGRLEVMCHHTYEALLLRSRGYGMAKAVLEAVGAEEGLNLKALVARLGRTPGATRDYLQWLVGVDAIFMEKKRYYYVDGLVRWWVRLHATGRPATAADLHRASQELLAPPAEAEEGPQVAATTEPPATASPARPENLMEID